jgi:selenocysteine lyase/cysteine desulfurase
MHFGCPPGYLNTPSIGIPPVSASEVLLEAVQRWRTGSAQPAEFDAAVEVARNAFARLCDVDGSTVVIGGSVSALVAILATSTAGPCRVLTDHGEFTSLIFPFAAQAGRGITIDEVSLERVPELAGEYDVVLVSVVQSSSGAMVDLGALREAVRGTGTRVILDVTHAAGWLPLHLDWADAAVCAGYKWLMSPRGVCWMSVRPDYAAELVAIAANWFAGSSRWDTLYGLPLRLASENRRFDASPAWFSHVGAAAVLPQLAELDMTQVQAHCVGLADDFRDAMGLPPSESAIVTVDRVDAAKRLARADVTASVRAGVVRLGFYIYNDQSDVDRAVDALR